MACGGIKFPSAPLLSLCELAVLVFQIAVTPEPEELWPRLSLIFQVEAQREECSAAVENI
jgi:hypothetical protein